MTVCIAVQVNDCIVFAADSATSLVGADGNGTLSITNIYNHGKKLFCLHKGLPVMAMTCGMGNLAGSSIEVLGKDLRALLTSDPKYQVDPTSYTMEEIAEKAFQFFVELYEPNKPAGPHAFELFIGGIPAGSRQGETWKFAFHNGEVIKPAVQLGQGNCGIQWAGQPEAVNRLVLGFSGALPEVLKEAGIEEPQLSQLVQSVRTKTQAELWHPAMPVQDAIDLAVFLVETTIDFTKFLPGANTVGGAVDVATVTRHEGFKWVRRKHFYPAHLNPLETDHVGGRKA